MSLDRTVIGNENSPIPRILFVRIVVIQYFAPWRLCKGQRPLILPDIERIGPEIRLPTKPSGFRQQPAILIARIHAQEIDVRAVGIMSPLARAEPSCSPGLQEERRHHRVAPSFAMGMDQIIAQ